MHKKCFVVFDAGSSKTKWHLFSNSTAILGPIKTSNQMPPLTNYLQQCNATGFLYDVIVQSSLSDALDAYDCSDTTMQLFATGGLRQQYSDNEANSFYDIIKFHFLKLNNFNKSFNSNTLSEKDEGRFVWHAHSKIPFDNKNDYTTIDFGGASFQVTTKYNSISLPFGKTSALNILGNRVKNCFNREFNNQYDGDACRSTLKEFLEPKFNDFDKKNFLTNNYIGAGLFKNVFNDVCYTYSQSISVRSKLDKTSLMEINQKCDEVKQKNLIFSVNTLFFKEIADKICQTWDKWDINSNQGYFASETCFSLNYIYSVLKVLTISDEQEVHISSFNWAMGLAENFFSQNGLD